MIAMMTTKGWTFNYYIADACVVMLDWNSTTTPDEEHASDIQTLTTCLIQRIQNTETSVWKDNLRIIREMMLRWTSCLEAGIPCTALIEQFARPDDPSGNLCGIHLVGMLAQSGATLYVADESRPELTAEIFYKRLVAKLSSTSSPTYKQTSMCIGGMLRALEGNTRHHGMVLNMTKHVLNDLFDQRSGYTDTGQFLSCLHIICDDKRGYPRMLDKALCSKLFSKLPTLNGEFLIHCLRLLYWGAESQPEDMMQELKGTIGIKILIGHQDSQVQAIFLELILKLWKLDPMLLKKDLVEMLPALRKAFVANRDAKCRKNYYTFVAEVYTRISTDEAGEDTVFTGMNDQLLTILREGLLDANAEIRKLVLTQWSTNVIREDEPTHRLESLMSSLYDDGFENKFLATATHVLLEAAACGSNFEQKLFNKPLEDCEWSEMLIDETYQNPNTLLIPLFAASQSMTMGTQTMGSQSQMGTQAGFGGEGGFIRATQEVGAGRFAMTQSQTGGSYSGGAASQSTYGGFGGPVGGTYTPRLKKRTRDPSSFIKTDTPSKKDHQKNRKFAKWADLKRKKVQKDKVDSKKRRLNEVHLQRKYRSGELPDIEINHSELIKPLQILALQDSEFAQLLFSELFESLYKVVQDKTQKGHKEFADRQAAIHGSLAQMVRPSLQNDALYVSCVLNLCTVVQEVEVNPEDIVKRSMSSMSFHSGILLLEHLLSNKIGSGEEQGHDVEHIWVALANLYQKIEEKDVVRGIFRSISTENADDMLCALDLEAEGRLELALTQYQAAAGQAQATVTMRGFCADSVLDLAFKLCKWDTVDASIKSRLDAQGGTGAARTISMMSDVHLMDPQMVAWTQQYLAYDLSQNDDGQQAANHNAGVHLFDFTARAKEHPDHWKATQNEHANLLSFCHLKQAVTAMQGGKKDGLVHKACADAEFYAAKSVQNFISKWPQLHPLMSLSRRKALQSLQPLAEMQEYFRLRTSSVLTPEVTDRVVAQWQKRRPCSLVDGLPVWESSARCRSILLDGLSVHLEDRARQNAYDDDYKQLVTNSHSTVTSARVRNQLGLTREGYAQRANDYGLSRQKAVFAFIKGKIPADSMLQRELAFEWRCLAANANFTKTRHHLKQGTDLSVRTNGLTQFKDVLVALHRLNDFVGIPSGAQERKDNDVLTETDYVRAHSLVAAGLWCFSQLLFESAALTDGSASFKEHYSALPADPKDKKAKKHIDDRLPKVLKVEPDATAAVCAKQAHARFLAVLQEITQPHEGAGAHIDPAVAEELATAHITLAQFADEVRQYEPAQQKIVWGSSASVADTMKDYQSKVVYNVLKAMELGSDAARDMFPKLLRILQEDPEVTNLFIQGAANVPCWMFITWIPQMLALINKPPGRALQGILKEIADEYPNALTYPLSTCRAYVAATLFFALSNAV